MDTMMIKHDPTCPKKQPPCNTHGTPVVVLMFVTNFINIHNAVALVVIKDV